MKRIGALWLLAAAVGLLGSGCSSLKAVQVRAVKPVNVDPEGNSLPVRVRVYKLKGREKFRKATFEDLWSKDRAVLGGDLVDDPIEQDVYPAGTGAAPTQIQLGAVPEEVMYIGIFALYSQNDERGGPRHVVLSRREAKGSVLVLTGYRVLVRKR